jgi:NAD dependent epimerase/dehydratase family enzyme
LLGSQRVIPRIMIDRGHEFRFPKLDAALNDLLA